MTKLHCIYLSIFVCGVQWQLSMCMFRTYTLKVATEHHKQISLGIYNGAFKFYIPIHSLFTGYLHFYSTQSLSPVLDKVGRVGLVIIISHKHLRTVSGARDSVVSNLG